MTLNLPLPNDDELNLVIIPAKPPDQYMDHIMGICSGDPTVCEYCLPCLHPVTDHSCIATPGKLESEE